ncbi:MAG: hypothetical protein ACUVX8_04450 [Candidatus Zipacnadales bacterium]
MNHRLTEAALNKALEGFYGRIVMAGEAIYPQRPTLPPIPFELSRLIDSSDDDLILGGG